MPKKRRRKAGPLNDADDFQMMDIDNPSPSVPIAASTSTLINVSQWDIDGDRIHGTSALASIEDDTALATDSTTQATFDNIEHYEVEVDPTFHDADADEDISPEHEPSPKRSFLAVSHSCLTSIICSSQSCIFHLLG